MILNFNWKLFDNICFLHFIFRIEEEEVNAYNTFDQNKDGIVSQDEKDVSNKFIKIQ